MELGLVGLTAGGKTQLFEALTGAHGAGGGTASQKGTVLVPDERVDALVRLSASQKTTYAAIDLRDAPGLSTDPSGMQYNDRLLGELRDTDALLLVVRVFRSVSVPHPLGELNPVRDAEKVIGDLHIADLGIAEKRLEKLGPLIQRSSKVERETYETEKSILEEVRAAIEEDKKPDVSRYSQRDLVTVKGYRFFSLKPLLIIANVSDMTNEGEQGHVEALQAWGAARQIPVVPINAALEAELLEFPEEERAPYYGEMGLPGSGLSALVQGAYRILDVITFLTTGPKESRAWTVPRGSTAKQAAGAIHSDIEQGFIRAEVTPFDRLIEIGSEAEAKRAGVVRTEGRDYIVQEADVILFHHSR